MIGGARVRGLARCRAALAGLRARACSPAIPGLRGLLLAYVAVQLLGIAWDLPASFEWENDGVAPRDFLLGVALNLPPGPGHTYPLLHNLLLMLLNLPVLLVAAATSPSWLDLHALRDHVLGYVWMTPIYLLAKLLTLAMSTMTLGLLARMAARLWNPRVGIWTAAVVAVNVAFSWYGRSSNLDAPYLFWSVLALDLLLDALQIPVVPGESIAMPAVVVAWRRFALAVAASIATKDQAYALWLLPALVFFLILPLRDPLWRIRAAADIPPSLRAHWRHLLRAMAMGLLALLALGGGLWNPPGFWHRLQTLAGPASQDWRHYARTWAGLQANCLDLARDLQPQGWPWLLWALVVAGIVVTALTPDPRKAARWLPLAMATGFLATFTLVVARTGHRFLLPAMVLVAVYAAVAIDALSTRLHKHRPLLAAILTAIWLLALGQVAAVLLTQWRDPRLDVESRLAAMPPGTRVETVGVTVAQPRWGLPSLRHLSVSRVGPSPAEGRNPLPGVTELRARYDALPLRAPDVLVLPGDCMPMASVPQAAGTVAVKATTAPSADGTQLFGQVAAGTLPGWRVTRFAVRWPAWATALQLRPQVVHSSTGLSVCVAVRNDGRARGAL